jgi:hypothetical protein
VARFCSRISCYAKSEIQGRFIQIVPNHLIGELDEQNQMGMPQKNYWTLLGFEAHAHGR